MSADDQKRFMTLAEIVDDLMPGHTARFEHERLVRSRDGWEREALNYCTNADDWRTKATATDALRPEELLADIWDEVPDSATTASECLSHIRILIERYRASKPAGSATELAGTETHNGK